MIKFFSVVRQKLLNEGNLKKYMRYALGEILLVVIGILIAVQLNNWNQHRIRQADVESLLDKIESDLVHNIIAMNEIIQDYYVNDSLTRKIIRQEVSIEDYYEDKNIGNLLLRINLLKLSIENVEKLISNQEFLPSKYETILSVAKELIRSLVYTEHTEVPLKEYYQDNVDFLMSQPDWMVSFDSTSLDTRYRFFMFDENYKKRVRTFWAKTKTAALTIIYHRSVSIELLARMKTIRNHVGIEQLHQLFKGLQLNAFNEVPCENVVKKNLNQDYRNERFLISNLNDNITYKVVIKNSQGSIMGTWSIKPNDYIIYQESTFKSGVTNEDYFSVVEIYRDDQCVQKFVEETNGYIFIK